MADVVEDEADKHEEEADQRERSSGADHFWGEDESDQLKAPKREKSEIISVK